MRLHSLMVLSACIGPLTGLRASAQCTESWSFRPEQGVPGVFGPVHALHRWDPDGRGPRAEVLVVGGRFSLAGQAAADNVAAWDGTSWSEIGGGVSLHEPLGGVFALSEFEGTLIVGGGLTAAGSRPVENIAGWNGHEWRPLGRGLTGAVRALHEWNGRLIAGGEFSSLGAQGLRLIAAWDGVGWEPLGSGITGSGVWALCTFGPDLIAGGSFTAAGGVPASNIAKWDGAAWTPLGAGVVAQFGGVRALEVFQDTLIVGGSFTYAGGQLAVNLARWDGANWSGPCSKGPFGGAVTSLRRFGDDLVIGGSFSGVACQGQFQQSRAIVRWNGTAWQGFNSGLGQTGSVRAVAEYRGRLVAGGTFAPSTPGVPVSYLDEWHGTEWRSLGVGVGGGTWTAAPVVRGLDVVDGELILTGGFSAAGGSCARAVAAWDGTTLRGLGAGPYAGGAALAAASYQGELVVGGTFLEGAIPANSTGLVARWDGRDWRWLGGGLSGGNGTGYGPVARALCVHDGELIVGGEFERAGSVPVKNVAAWNGRRWRALSPGLISTVYALAEHEGDLIAAGAFAVEGSAAMTPVARWDGTRWSAVGGAVPGFTLALALAHYDGALIASGRSESGADAAVVRWDGSGWEPIGRSFRNSPSIPMLESLAVHRGELYVAGAFTAVGGRAVRNLARWDGHEWQDVEGGVGPGTNTGEWVEASAVRSYGGSLVVGGNFRFAANQVSFLWASRECRCYADCDDSGALSPSDFGCFQTAFVQGNMYADCDGSGVLTIADFGCFQTKFVAGCP